MNLWRRIQLMIGRCVIKAAEAGGGRVLVTIDGLEGEQSDGLEYAEPWGLTSVPLPGAEGITLAIMGDRSHRAVIPMGDERYRPTDLAPGETAIFDDLGHRIVIRRDGIEIVSPDDIEVTCQNFRINGQPVATVTDLVQVGSGSSAGQWPIITGVENGA